MRSGGTAEHRSAAAEAIHHHVSQGRWPLLLGAALAAPATAMTLLLPEGHVRDLSALGVAAVAWIYFGLALADGRLRAMAVEALVATGFLALAAVGLRESAILLAAGFLLHPLWDVLHHPRSSLAAVPAWYPSACIAYDWIAGAAILVRFA